MFKFFRHIRQNLIMENKTSKYLKYAIGEIVLVMIGILLALQVNNWNEERKNNVSQSIIIKNLHNEFSENLIILNTSISRIDKVIKGFETLLQIMNQNEDSINNSEFENILESTFTTPSWTPSSFVLEELKNSGGLSRLKDEKLKKLLFEWERNYASILKTEKGYDDYAFEYIEYLTNHGSVRNLDAINGSIPGLKKSTITTNDVDLLRDPLFENRADNFYFLSNQLISKYRDASKKIEAILKQTSN